MTDRERSNPTDAPAPAPGIDRAGIDSLLADIGALCGGSPAGSAARPENDPLAGLVAQLERSTAPAPPDLAAPPAPATAPDARAAATPEDAPAPLPSRAPDSVPLPAAGLAEPATLAPPATDPEPDPEAAPASDSTAPPPATALGSLDDALADDVGDLLGGNFETVSAVLGDGGELTATELAAPAPAPHAAPTDDADLPDDAFSFAPPEGGDAPAESGSRPLPTAGGVESEPLPARASPEPPEAAEPLPPAPDPPEPTAAEPEPEPPEPPEPQPEPPETAAPSAPRGRLATIWIRAEPFVVDVLEVANIPLRRVPPSLRPVVDWIALSLVFWVPIVWVVALFVIG